MVLGIIQIVLLETSLNFFFFLIGFLGYIKRKVSIKQNTLHKILNNIKTKFKIQKEI